MNQKQENLIVALDIGSAWTRVLAADLYEDSLRYRGHGMVRSAGMRKGLIAELNPAIKAVKAALEQAEQSARANLHICMAGVGGPHVLGFNNSGELKLGNRMREITEEDMRAAIHYASMFERPPDRAILHLLRRQYILDGQPGVFDPLGMVGAHMRLELHVATCSGSAWQSTVTCANKAGLEVSEAVLESIAAAECALTADERELGICLLDIGAHSTDIIVFFEGAVVLTASVPIGGAHFTNDLAKVLEIPTSLAEELKREVGNAVVTDVPQSSEIEINNPDPRRLPVRTIAEILEARARELFKYVRDTLREGGIENQLGAGCVLTGGGSLLPGMLDVASSQLRMSARTALPVRLPNMPADLVHPGFSAIVGMVLYAHRTRKERSLDKPSFRAKFRAAFAASF
jgi:cell division protein FtsA